MKKIIQTISFLAFIFLSCSTSPDKAIQKRWKAVDVRGDEDMKERYKKRFARNASELEFKEGKFNAYQDGVIRASAPYTMASDGKSLVVTDGGITLTVRIVSLDGETLHAILDGFMSDRDTIIYKASGK